MRQFKVALLVLTLTFALLLSSCAFLGGFGSSGEMSDDGTHIHSYGEWKTVRSASCTEMGERIKTCIVCGTEKIESISKSAHRVQTVLASPSTCTVEGKSEYKRCADCKITIEEPTTLPLASHTEVIIPATSDKTEGKKCSVCNMVLVSPTWIFTNDFTNPENYNGNYAYNYLAELVKGPSLTALYDRIDAVADGYHLGDLSCDSYGIISEITFSDLGLTTDEAIGVWIAYRYDHPLYYWMSRNIAYTDKIIKLYSYSEYSNNSYRAALNLRIYKAVEDFVSDASAADDTYEITLAFHNAIILAAEYARDGAGKPESAEWAHSIVGIVEYGKGVCESYAEMFQLLLNYCDIDNVYVTGSSRGEGHAWNIVKLSDGEWYWYDLTWDDTPTHDRHISYNYFCVSNNQYVGWQDGNYVETNETFASGHIPDSAGGWGTQFAYELPVASATPFKGNEALIKSTFVQDGFTYSICNPGEVQLVWIDKEGDIVIPDSVVYNGERYNVVAVGPLKENGISYGTGSVSNRKIESVHIGKNVTMIWYFALNLSYVDQVSGNTYTALKSITVDEENSVYEAIDGVLYDKSGNIIWIPKAVAGDIRIHPLATRLCGGDNDEINFSGCSSITSIIIPVGVNHISSRAISNCKRLSAIDYLGTVEQWNAITKGIGWSVGLNATIVCANGEITIKP